MTNKRLKKELAHILENPPEGIACYPASENNFHELTATIIGPPGSPYEGGAFTVSVEIDESYPFKPPLLRFVTPIYHPNIDSGGRICLDLLKMPPAGSWNVIYTLANLLVAVRELLSSPNPDDPLMEDIAMEYVRDRSEFLKKAKQHTLDYAM